MSHTRICIKNEFARHCILDLKVVFAGGVERVGALNIYYCAERLFKM